MPIDITLRFHQLHQDDLEVDPLLCVHEERSDSRVHSSSRVFCLWAGGVQVGGKVVRWWPKAGLREALRQELERMSKSSRTAQTPS